MITYELKYKDINLLNNTSNNYMTPNWQLYANKVIKQKDT